MKALIEFIASYEPRYAQVVQGVPDGKVAELEQVLGRQVPPAYRDFLTTIGQNLGFLTGDVCLDIDAVIDIAGCMPDGSAERFVPVAQDESAGGHDYYLDMSHPRAEGDALVVKMSLEHLGRQETIPFFGSLHDMLFSWAFWEVRMLPLTARAQLVWLPSQFHRDKPSPSLPALASVMAKLGFDALTVTSAEAQLYERGDCAAVVYRVPFAEWFSLKLAARARHELLRVADTIRSAMPGEADLFVPE